MRWSNASNEVLREVAAAMFAVTWGRYGEGKVTFEEWADYYEELADVAIHFITVTLNTVSDKQRVWHIASCIADREPFSPGLQKDQRSIIFNQLVALAALEVMVPTLAEVGLHPRPAD